MGEDNNVDRVGDDDDDGGDGDDDIGGDGPLSQMGKCVEAWVFVHVPAVQLFNWTWHGTRNKQQHFAFVLYFAVFCLKKCFLFFSICRCWQACQIVRQIQRKAPSYRIFKMMIKQIAMVRMIIKYY